MTYDASDPAQVAKAEREEEDAEKDVDFIVSQPRGRRWLYRLMFSSSHLTSPSFVPGSFDSIGRQPIVRAAPQPEPRCVHEDARREPL